MVVLMAIHVFVNIVKAIESRQRFVSLTEDCDEYCILNCLRVWNVLFRVLCAILHF